MANQFPITEKTEITRLPKRGVYDKDVVYSILDEVLFCTLAYAGVEFTYSRNFDRQIS